MEKQKEASNITCKVKLPFWPDIAVSQCNMHLCFIQRYEQNIFNF